MGEQSSPPEALALQESAGVELLLRPRACFGCSWIGSLVPCPLYLYGFAIPSKPFFSFRERERGKESVAPKLPPVQQGRPQTWAGQTSAELSPAISRSFNLLSTRVGS